MTKALSPQQKAHALIEKSNTMHGSTLADCFRDVPKKTLPKYIREILRRHGQLTVAQALTRVSTQPVRNRAFYEEITILSEIDCPGVNHLYVLWPFYGAAIES